MRRGGMNITRGFTVAALAISSSCTIPEVDTSATAFSCTAAVQSVTPRVVSQNLILDFNMESTGCSRSAGRFDFDVRIVNRATGQATTVARATS